MSSEAQKKASAQYDAKNTKGLYIKLNKNTDRDILDRLNDVSDKDGGKQGYVKALIRADIQK